MTAQTRAILKANFETGDVPDGTNYVDLVDSFLAIVDTTAQSLASDLTVPTLIATTEVSAGDVIATKVSASSGSFVIVSADRVHASAATFLAVVSADRIHASAATFGATVSADSIAASSASISVFSAATISFNTIATALATASAVGGTGINVSRPDRGQRWHPDGDLPGSHSP